MRQVQERSAEKEINVDGVRYTKLSELPEAFRHIKNNLDSIPTDRNRAGGDFMVKSLETGKAYKVPFWFVKIVKYLAVLSFKKGLESKELNKLAKSDQSIEEYTRNLKPKGKGLTIEKAIFFILAFIAIYIYQTYFA